MKKLQPKNPNLIETTSSIQKKRGQRKFFDLNERVSYVSYANGYVRREINYTILHLSSNEVTKRCLQYQLNKTVRTPVLYSNHAGEERTFYRTNRVMINNERERLNLIDKASSNYKGYQFPLQCEEAEKMFPELSVEYRLVK